MDKKFLLNELKVLQNKTFKALNVFEEKYHINPPTKKERKRPIVKYPLPYVQYVDVIVKDIEGTIKGLNVNKTEELLVIDGLNTIKHSLLSISNIGDPQYYKVLRQKIFKNLNDFDILIEQVER